MKIAIFVFCALFGLAACELGGEEVSEDCLAQIGGGEEVADDGIGTSPSIGGGEEVAVDPGIGASPQLLDECEEPEGNTDQRSSILH